MPRYLDNSSEEAVLESSQIKDQHGTLKLLKEEFRMPQKKIEKHWMPW